MNQHDVILSMTVGQKCSQMTSANAGFSVQGKVVLDMKSHHLVFRCEIYLERTSLRGKVLRKRIQYMQRLYIMLSLYKYVQVMEFDKNMELVNTCKVLPQYILNYSRKYRYNNWDYEKVKNYMSQKNGKAWSQQNLERYVLQKQNRYEVIRYELSDVFLIEEDFRFVYPNGQE